MPSIAGNACLRSAVAAHPATASMVKLAVTELQQVIAELGVRVLGEEHTRFCNQAIHWRLSGQI